MELEEAFLWPNLLAHYLVRHIGAQALRDSALCSARRASSFFSGLGTSELAWFVVGLALLRFGLEASLTCISACENSACCRGALLRHTGGCVFGDIMDFIATSALDPSDDFDRKFRIIMGAAVRRAAWCYRCGAQCRLIPSDIDSSGSPCQDFSTAGLQQGRNGPRSHILLAWLRIHLVLETAIIVLENVPTFDLELLQLVMGTLYVVIAVVCGPEHVGFRFSKRRRMYCAMVHKTKVTILFDIVAVFQGACLYLQQNGVTLRLHNSSYVLILLRP